MAYGNSLVRAKKARPSSTIGKALAAISLSACAYGFAVPGTGGVRAVDLETELPVAPIASLSFNEDAPIITGTVASLFQSEIFSGANRLAKTDRVRPDVNMVAFTQHFDAIRLSIADERSAGTNFADRQAATMVAQSSADQDSSARISVAAIDPDMASSEGLRAIDELADGEAVGSGVVQPVAVPEALAYGRDNTPATDFTPQHTWSEREQWCLATGIYFEARGESYRGQVAVAQTIMNRVEHEDYPSTICGVVYQNQHRRNACQFSFACDGIPDRVNEQSAWALAEEITSTVLNKEIYLTEVADATHYHATYVNPHWARNMDKLTQVGLHVFYRFKQGWLFG